jgi:hypothetical protein
MLDYSSSFNKLYITERACSKDNRNYCCRLENRPRNSLLQISTDVSFKKKQIESFKLFIGNDEIESVNYTTIEEETKDDVRYNGNYIIPFSFLRNGITIPQYHDIRVEQIFKNVESYNVYFVFYFEHRKEKLKFPIYTTLDNAKNIKESFILANGQIYTEKKFKNISLKNISSI